MSIKRFTAAVLCLIMIAGIAGTSISCAKSDDNNSGGTAENANADSTTEATTETGRESATDNVPADLKFNGQTFTILSREEFVYGTEMGVEEENGDVVNDAIYRRNKSVEDRFDIKINVVKIPGIWGQEASFNNTVKNSVKAGDNAYDLIAGYAYFITPLAVEGNFLNWNKVQYIDSKAPWWSADLADKMTIDGKLYFITGDLSQTLITSMMVLYFNKKLQSDYGLEDFYQTVFDGKWTYDHFYSICKDIYTDVNGDGQKDEGDLYGLAAEYGNYSDQIFVSQNQPITQKGDDGYPVLALNSPKTSEITDNMMSLFFENPGVYSMPETTERLSRDMFKNGQALFNMGLLEFTDYLRDMKDDFGILPFPKFDESQEKYTGLAQDAYSLFSVPATSNSPDFVGAVTEALAAESYRSVTPSYYETALKIKYARDDVTSQMLDIIRDGMQFDFAFVNSNSMNNIIHIFRELCNTKNKNFVSLYEKNEPKYQNALDKIIEGYKELPE